ncbi:hypothetical protein [Geminocystis sp.]|uniref:hypothetical protein n=1 Tax=Geminocystis sp. TaxID=2664100 RepID=UPI003594584C
MNYSLKLEISQTLYENLVKTATKTGKTKEEIAIEVLQTSVKNLIKEDPLDEFIGSINSNINDWTEKHDQYLGNILNEKI